MKKIALSLFICISFIYTEAQWTQVPGYQISYNDVLGVTRHQGNIWVLTKTGIYKIVGSTWELTSAGISVVMGIGCIYSDGIDLYAGGLFAFGSQQVLVIKWDGTQWLPLAYTNDFAPSRVLTLIKTSNSLYAGGFFNSIGATPFSINTNLNYWASFDGAIWSQPFSVSTTGCAASIESIQKIADSLYVAGGFNEIGGIWTPGTFRFKENGAMSVLDGYGSCAVGRDYQLFQSNLYVGGTRQHDNINILTGLTKRTGGSWSSVSSQMQLIDTRLTKLLGKMYIAGVPNGGLNGVPTNIVSYDGATFINEGADLSHPNGSTYPSVNAIFADTIENKLYVSGNFRQQDGNIADNFAVRSFSIVPIRLSSFNAKLVANNQVLLSWRDETPSDQNKFEVQVSTDGRNFYKIGLVSGKANLYDYSFPYKPIGCGNLFFQLFFENKYSEVRPIELPCSGPKIIVGKQSLIVDTKVPGTLVISSITGQTLARTVLASGYSSIPLVVPSGVYFTKFIDQNNNVFVKKLFIQ